MLKWMVILATLVYLADSIVSAQEVPMASDDPKVNKTLNTEMFDFISKILGAGKMAPHMNCTLKTRSSRELRKFSGGDQWVEVLDVDFNSNGFDSGQKINFRIPITAKYGVRQSTNQWSGLGEDIKVELGDYYEHWLKFSHDGQGRIVQIMMGNNLKTVPCYVR